VVVAAEHARLRPRTLALALALGLAQLIAWGSLYYSIAVLGEAMLRDLRIDRGVLYGAFAWSLALCGLLAPWAGRELDRGGARRVMTASLLVGALGFALLAHTQSAWLLVVAWTVLGLAMALGLYDTCFAAIAQASPRDYRPTVTAVTLIAGLASTVFWPLSHYLQGWVGWRGACWCFAVLLLGCMPLYLCVLPRHVVSDHRELDPTPRPRMAQRSARLFAWAFAGIAFVSAALSAHLVTTLADLHFTGAHAVWIASSIGVMQVLGRIAQVRTARVSAQRLGAITFGMFALSLLALLSSAQRPAAIAIFALSYGASNGIMTIVKAVIPVEIFGTHEAGVVLGRFSAPSLIARAVGPWAYAAVQDASGGTEAALWAIVAVALISLITFLSGSVASARASTTHR
jgi:predicted MFS family arabinose efflux permease